MPITPRSYENRPYVRPAYEPDTRTLLDLMRMAGESQTRAIGRRGEARAQGLMTLGQMIGQALASQRQGRERQQLAERDLADRQSARAQDEAFRRDQLSSIEQDRAFNRTLRDDAQRQAEEARRTAAGVRFGAETAPGPISEAGIDVAAGDPTTFERVRYAFGPGTAEGPELQPTPEQARMARSEAEIRAMGGTLGPNGQVVLPPQAPREAQPTEWSILMQAAGGDPTKALQLRRQQQAASPLAPVVVQTPEGPAVLNRDTLTAQPITMGGKTVGPAPSAMERMDSRKFAKSAPILRGIGELSERINTLQGVVAKATGEVERQKARVNLNDDVAEYEALISGFTPMIARALGHIGVLTEQDVQSVKALFPRPGDSRTLRDRKINRMMGIIGELENTEGVPNVAPTPRNNDPLGLRR